MEESEIKAYAEESLKEGYSKSELKKVLIEEGFEEKKVEGLLTEIDDSKFRQSLGTAIKGLELEDDSYTVEKGFIRNRYRVKDPEGDIVLKASQKLFRPEESFSFKDSEGEEVFRVDAEQALDFSGDYTLKDTDGEAFAVLEKLFSPLEQHWKVKTPDGDEQADIKSRGKVFTFLRTFSSIFDLVPYRYSIESSDGEDIGSIEGKFNIRNKYDIEIKQDSDVSHETVVAAAVTADALR